VFVGLHGKALRDERQQREDGDEQANHVLMILVIPCKDSFFFSISDPLQLQVARTLSFFLLPILAALGAVDKPNWSNGSVRLET